MENLNCPNCGAPVSGERCEYCGAVFIDCTTQRPDKPFYLKFSPDGRRKIITKVMLERLEYEARNLYDTMYRGLDGKIARVYSAPDQYVIATYRLVN